MSSQRVQSRDDVVSKTARASAVRQKSGAFVASVEVPRIVPLCGGVFVYLRCPVTGLTRRYRALSQAFVDAVAALPEQWQDVIAAELRELSVGFAE